MRGSFAAALMVFAAVAMTAGVQPSSYTATQVGEIVRLEDAKAQTTVSVKPSAGNVAFEMLVKGHNVLVFSGASPEAFKGGLTGIPFVGPWANRLDEPAFYANGKRYAFDMQLGNVRGAIPIHGFLTGNAQSPVSWDVVEVRSDDSSAWVTSRLEFSSHPMWMKQFPFAHTIEMTHRLQNGVLEVTTTITNHSVEPMPVAIGFHPYFQLTDTPRPEWKISIGARTHWLLASTKVPTGETEPIEKQFPDPKSVPLKDYDVDDVYGDLIRDTSGRATMTVKGTGSQQLDVSLGPNWRSVVIWAPNPGLTAPAAGAPGRGGAQPPRNFVCFEPMAGITDAMNLAQKGLYKELQSIPPRGAWKESFWIRPSGF
jgi:aldose 1-epimerase